MSSGLKRDRRILAGLATAIGMIPFLINNPYYLTVLNLSALNILTVCGLTLLIGYAGQISLGHAGFWALGAYGSALLSLKTGLNPWLTTALALGFTLAVSAGMGFTVLRLKGNYLVMATLAFNLAVYFFLVEAEELTGGPPGLPGIPPYTLGSLAFVTDLAAYYLIWPVVLITLFLTFNLVHSGEGRALRALASGEIAAACLGINPRRYKVLAFVLSAAYASLAGSLYAHYFSFISPKTFDIFFSVELVAMCLFGGKGSLWGAVLGAGLLTPLPHFLSIFDEYRDLIYGGLLMGVLIFFPDGLSGLMRKLYGRKAP
ncbi:branched-chain amino acid ABC transporter permease [Thermosulfurimonas dismutans]|uniref:Branched-chain amino acid transport system permease protein LivM n=1 Tax=Thermosulfurimonas dismutans TaxID=999894 RepID=A0A179D345_9BACT|nr:branched-chain amino acid ABC transporter permease [Thermosulfurimonas dismutans]OAQ20500.1 Branched-chain amino acid transport system permease protein LivM [Thermosulfurimonas dismutans]